ncbi:MAG: acyl carrier protein [Lachnospiraceae bacterium]|jgi:acyl carrier protein|nr:acyl carrier protein [Lachnospiraceae bacterium]
MDRTQINTKLEEVIGEVMPEIEKVDFAASITQQYGVNSVSLIRLILAVESKFDVSFNDYELALSSYDTFGDLAATVAEKIA